jgi:type I restriction enzyme S subunit
MKRPAPEGWRAARLSDVADIVIGGTPSRSNPAYWDSDKRGGNRWASIADLKGPLLDQTSEHITDEGVTHSNVKLVPAGHVLMSFKLTIGRVAVNQVPLYTNEAIAALMNLRGVNRDFLKYALPEAVESVEQDEAVKGKTLNKERLKGLPILLPPLAEQEKIAEVLGSVDAVIAATRRVIEQTRSVKRALMQELFTRGIPGRHTRFKDSPLGKIPAGWQVRTGNQLFVLGSGHAPADMEFNDEGDLLFVKVDDFNDARNRRSISASVARFRREEQKLDIKLFPPGTIIFPKRGAAIFKSRVRQLARAATVDSNLMCLTPIGVNPDFICMYLEWLGLHQLSDNSGVPQINNKHLYPMRVPVPPAEEQARVVAILSTIDDRLDGEAESLSAIDRTKVQLMHGLLSGDIAVSTATSLRINPRMNDNPSGHGG